MIALIYAAGSSLRIKKSINIEHKSLLIVKNKKLIEHQLYWIEKSNAKKIAQQNLIDETLQKLHAKGIGVKALPEQVEDVLNNFIAVRSLTKKN